MKNKAVRIILCIITGLLLTVLAVLVSFSIGEKIMFSDFYSSSERYEKIPGLWSGFVPQGYCQVEGQDLRLACGYMSNDKSSRIYLIPNDGSNATFVEMRKADGSAYTGHTGGITVCGDMVYVTGSTGCDIFSYADIIDGDGIAKQKTSCDTIVDPAYCSIYDGKLYVGSFYRAGNYETPEEHRMTTPAGDENMAILAVYTVDPATGLPTSDVPERIYSTTGLVQGMALTDDGRIILSTSYGFAKSHLYVYDLARAEAESSTFTVNDASVPLYYLDSACLVKTVEAPPMSEEIIYSDGQVYVMTESACMKYVFGKLTTGSYVYGYELDS